MVTWGQLFQEQMETALFIRGNKKITNYNVSLIFQECVLVS